MEVSRGNSRRWGMSGVAMVCAVLLAGCATFFGGGTSSGPRSTNVIYSVKVEKGDTLASIAAKFDTDWRQIARDNGLGARRELKVGQTIRVRPGPAGLVAGAPAPAAGAVAPPAPGGTDPSWREEDLTAPANARKAPANNSKGLLFGGSKTGAAAGTVFKWPVNGSVSSGFGPRWGRFHNGIDIRSPRGTPIKAAMDGRVIFAGRQRGYGKTVIINHGNWRTLYGHAGKLLVRQGQWVEVGDSVGLVGSTGNSRGVHLHFEIRTAGDRPIDPMPLLESRLLSRNEFVQPPMRITADWLLAGR